MKNNLTDAEMGRFAQATKDNEQVKEMTKDLDLSFSGWVAWIQQNWTILDQIMA